MHSFKTRFIILSFLMLLPKIALSASSWTQQAAADWGAGSGINIDTTTHPGNVQISASLLAGTTFNITLNTAAQWGAGSLVNIDTTSSQGKVKAQLVTVANLSQTAAALNSGGLTNTVVAGSSIQLQSQTYQLITSYTTTPHSAVEDGDSDMTSEDSDPDAGDTVATFDLSDICDLANFTVTSISGGYSGCVGENSTGKDHIGDSGSYEYWTLEWPFSGEDIESIEPSIQL